MPLPAFRKGVRAVAPGILDNIDVVLVGTLNSGNIGSAARAMANTGMSRLSLVSPRCAIDDRSFAMATHGDTILRRARKHTTLRQALAESVRVVGTTARGRRWRDAHEPRQLAAQILQHARGGRVALVFGPEDTGLSNGELELCHDVMRMPTAPGAASLNLSHAVLLAGYELFLACRDHRAAGGTVAEPASVSMMEAMYDHMRESLLEIGFLNPQNPDYGLGMIRRILSRTGLTVSEARLLRGMFRQLVWYIRTRGGRS